MLKHMPFADWPAADRQLFEAAFRASDDPFDDAAGPGADLRPRSKTTICYGYAGWLAWLVCEMPEFLADPPAERVTRERIKAYAAALGNTMKPASVASYIAWLFFACGYMFPSVQWDWLREVKTRLESNAPKRPHRAMPFDSVGLQDVGLKMMDEADALLINLDRTDQRPVRDVVELYRDGLIIALVALTGLRRRNLQSLTLGNSIKRAGDVWYISIDPRDSKTKLTIEISLPESISSRIDCYITKMRPIFPGALSHRGLWCAWMGRPLTDDTLYRLFKRRVFERTGHDLTLHDARRIIATSIPVFDPANAAAASQVLGHVNERVTERHYNQAKGVEASRRMTELISSMRKRIRSSIVLDG
jgi:integrase